MCVCVVWIWFRWHYVENRAIKLHSRGRRADITQTAVLSVQLSFSVIAKDVTKPECCLKIYLTSCHADLSALAELLVATDM